MTTFYSSPTVLSQCLILILSLLSLTSLASSNKDTNEKRTPFSSWAGKRSGSTFGPGPRSRLIENVNPDVTRLIHDLQEYQLIQEGQEDLQHHANQNHGRDVVYSLDVHKRAPFSSWAGKRAPFSSWAGKRAPFSSWAGKRAPFSSWAGKRSMELLEDTFENMPKHRFKRSSGEQDSQEQELGLNREVRSFSTWGGKRNQLRRFARNAPNGQLVPVAVMRPHRAAFSAWGGR